MRLKYRENRIVEKGFEFRKIRLLEHPDIASREALCQKKNASLTHGRSPLFPWERRVLRIDCDVQSREDHFDKMIGPISSVTRNLGTCVKEGE